MLRTIGKLASATVALTVGGLLVLAPVPAQNRGEGQESGVEQDAASELGLIPHAGGGVRGKRAKTQTAPTTFIEGAGWVTLPLGNVTWTVPAATTDLFNVAFSAECRMIGSIVPSDGLRIRVVDVVGGVIVGAFEPYDGTSAATHQVFCSALGRATHKGNWARRVQAGAHTIYVQFWVLSPGANVTSAVIKNWALELVVYD